MSNNLYDRTGLLLLKDEREGEFSENSTTIPAPNRTPPLSSSHHRQSSSQDSEPLPEYHSPRASLNGFDRDQEAQRLELSTGSQASNNRLSFGFNSISSIPSPAPSNRLSGTFPDTRHSPSTAAASQPQLSPPWQRFDTTQKVSALEQVRELDERKLSLRSLSFREDFFDISRGEIADEGGLRAGSTNNDNEDTRSIEGCPSKEDIHSRRTSWLSISILGLSIYSTLFSGIWVILAIVQPRYGRRISTDGSLTLSTASTIFALVAKTIELSFVTVFVTFLGQVLSRRSLVKTSRGITISELTMRTWVIQPGSMITHWQNLQHAGISLVGIITLTAALVAMFYTTASDALVSPHLKFGRWESTVMSGLVRTSYANVAYIKAACKSPISFAMDPLQSGATCMSIENAGEAYHNSITYLGTWADIATAGKAISSNIKERPQAPAMLYDNTTVIGSWVYGNTSDMNVAYDKYGRIINNVTLSMPHAGVSSAARDNKNDILQPSELGGVGEYQMKASVVSPSVNVMCVNTNATDLDPLVYATWEYKNVNSNGTIGANAYSANYEDDVQLLPGKEYLNSTVLDDIFGWGEKYGRQPPVFPMYPIDYNTVTNISTSYRDSLYLLLKAPQNVTSDYTVCSFRSYLSSQCSTWYNVSGTTGGLLQAHCEDPLDPLAYYRSIPNAPQIYKEDWKEVGTEWMLSLSLNTGISDANASNARLLAQLIQAKPASGPVTLPPSMPSIAETLAVMAGSTLLMSSTDSMFYHFWDYSTTTLTPGSYEQFNVSRSSQEYTSGNTQNWQSVFYIVLMLVFATNIFCLVYLFLRSGLVTDFTEPQNMFALAINSPPSRGLYGSCGAGPENEQLNLDWHIVQEESSGHFYIRDGGNAMSSTDVEMRRRQRQNSKPAISYSKLSRSRESWL